MWIFERGVHLKHAKVKCRMLVARKMWREKFFFVVIHVYIKTFLLSVMTYMTPLTVLTVKYKWISWETRGCKYTDVSLAICSRYRSFGGWQVINFSALDADIGGVWRIANCFTGLGRGYWGNALWVTVGGFPKIRDFSRKISALLLPGALCMAMLLHARINGDDRFIKKNFFLKWCRAHAIYLPNPWMILEV